MWGVIQTKKTCGDRNAQNTAESTISASSNLPSQESSDVSHTRSVSEPAIPTRARRSFFNLLVLMLLSVVCMTSGIVLMTACKNPAQGPSTDAASVGSTVEVGDFKYYISSTTAVRVDGLATGQNPLHINIPNTVVIDSVTYNVTAINASAFLNNITVTTITIGENIIKVGDKAFRGCTNVTELIFNAVLYYEAFPEGSNSPFYELGTSGDGVQLSFGSTVQLIPNYFLGYQYSTQIYRPKMIGTIKIPDSVVSIGVYAFASCTGFTALDLGTGVKNIRVAAFYGCSGLAGTLTIPDSVTNIEGTVNNGAFAGCTGFTALNLGICVKTIEYAAFFGCTGFTGTLTIPDSVTSIGEYAFSGGRFSSLNLGVGVQTIRVSAFSATDITTIRLNRFIRFPIDITTIPASPNLPSSLTKIIVPYGSGTEYKNAVGWKTVAEIIEEEEPNTDGILTYADRGTYWEVTGLLDSGYDGAIDIPDQFSYGDSAIMPVTQIVDGAFMSEGYLSRVTIGSNVTYIGNYAFYDCTALTGTLTIPNSVKTIGNATFYGCIGFIGTLIIPNSVTTIGNSAFNGCTGFTGTLIIPASVTTIGQSAFAGTDITILHLKLFIAPSTITTINFSSPILPTVLTKIFVPYGSGAVYKAATGWSTKASIIEEEPITDGVLKYEDSGTYWEVTGLLEPGYNGPIDIPAQFTFGDGATKPVTNIADNAFKDEIYLTGITSLGANMTTIGASAFQGCIGLWGDLNIPNSVKTIGASAFLGCSGINGTITIGTAVTSVGNGAFSGCTNVIGLTWNAVNYTASFSSSLRQFNNLGSSSSGVQVNFGDTVKRIPDYFMYLCSYVVGNLKIPNSVTYVGDWAFQGCGRITGTITIGTAVTYIGSGAFNGCVNATGLTWNAQNYTAAFPSAGNTVAPFYSLGTTGSGVQVNFGDTVQKIPDYFLYGYLAGVIPKVTGDLTIPNSVTYIGTYAFQGCTSINGTITIGTAVTSIGNSAFSGCTNVTGLTWNAINTAAFPSAGDTTAPFYNLGTSGAGVTVRFGGTVQRIPDYFLGNLSATAKVTGVISIPNSVLYIGTYAFFGCSGFTGDLNIPNSVTTIGDFAFYYCSGFTGTLTIGNSVTTVGNFAFSSCSGFTGTLTIGNSVTTIGDRAFAFCSGFTGDLNIPNSVTTVGNFAFRDCTGFTGNLTIGSSVTTVGNFAFNSCSGFTGTLTIGNSVTTIGNYAFQGCSGFTGSLTIPSSVTKIETATFYGCSGFTGDLNIPNSVTTIGDGAFQDCTGFTGTITIGNSVTNIGDWAFYNCNKFTALYLGAGVQTIGDGAFQDCSGFTGDLNIPNSVTTIGDWAFYNCNKFTALYLGAGVQTIGDWAFQDCSGFTGDLNIPNSVTTIGSSAFLNTNITTFRLNRFTSPSAITNLEVNFGSPGFPSTLQHIVVPNGSGDVYRSAAGWSHESAVDKIVEVTQTITWSNLQGVTNPNDFSIYDIDQTTTLQPLPNRTGWNFKQWRLNNASGAVVSSIAEYTQFGPITLYAEWEASATVVSFATGTAPSDGGSITGTIANRNRYADQSFTLPTQKYAVANNNWEHVGWTITQYGKQIQNWETLDTADFALGATISADDIYWGTTRTFYAVWKRLTNTLTFKPGTLTDDSGNVTITGTQFTEIKTPSVDINLPTAPFTVTGYTQIGWTLDFVTGGAIVGRPLHNSYTLAIDPQITNTDETYYPVWKPEEYTIQYRPGNYSYGLTPIPNATKYHGATITITSTQYQNSNGYVQVGWTTTTNGGLYSDTPVTHALNSTYSGNAALTLYPVWQSGTGVVILHFTGGPNGEYLSDISTVWVFDYTNPSTLTLPSYSTMNSLGRSLTFEGWYTSPDFNPTSRISDPASYAISAPADRTEDYSIPWTLGDNTVIKIYANWN